MNAQFQFAEYLGLTMVQLIFDRNLKDSEFIEIFKSEDAYQPVLDKKLVATQHIVEEKHKFFEQAHKEYQTAMVEKLLKSYIQKLQDNEILNGGYPDTDSMKIAIFGQIAFKYE